MNKEERDINLIHHFLKKVEIEIGVYLDLIEELEDKKYKLYREQNGLLADLNKKREGAE